jgi:hypothetical protein
LGFIDFVYLSFGKKARKQKNYYVAGSLLQIVVNKNEINDLFIVSLSGMVL